MKKIIVITSILFCSLNLFSTPISQLKVGDQAPDFSLTDPYGKVISLSSLKGRVLLIDFWASWCMPCRMANQDLVNIYDVYHPLGFDIISVSLDTKKEPWISAIQSDDLHWPNHVSEMRGWDSKIAALYGVDMLPYTFLIDEQGIIIATKLDDYDIDQKLKNIFYEQVYFYPHTASEKLYFSGKSKYEILDHQGNSVLKGKEEDVDLTGLPEGHYTIKYENKQDKFHKKIFHTPPVTFYPQNVEDNITLSKESHFEIYNHRGKLIRKGHGTVLNVKDLNTGAYHISIDGRVSNFFKK